jgi:hypothetical protein
VPVRGRLISEGIRFAAGVASKPSGVVTLWQAATGGKTVACIPSTPVPELPHAAGLLPIALESREDLSVFSGRVAAWLVGTGPPPICDPPASIPCFAFPPVPPAGLEEALERIEDLAEWAGVVSGSPPSEGGIWKSIRAYAIRSSLLDALGERCARDPAFLTGEERKDIVRAGNFLPPEAHSRLISSILGIEPESASDLKGGEGGDPLLFLARRLIWAPS